MRASLISLLGLVGLVGCASPSPSPAPSQGSSARAREVSVAPAAPPASAPASSLQHLFPAERAFPRTGEPFREERIVCPKDAGQPRSGRDCFCLAPYECKEKHCTFDKELAFVKEKLARKEWARFEYAEFGDCGRHRYLYMDRGETLGSILVLYDPAGRKIALERRSDYNEFCHGRALHAFFGQIPDCRQLHRRGVLCPNDRARRPRSPLESLTALAK